MKKVYANNIIVIVPSEKERHAGYCMQVAEPDYWKVDFGAVRRCEHGKIQRVGFFINTGNPYWYDLSRFSPKWFRARKALKR